MPFGRSTPLRRVQSADAASRGRRADARYDIRRKAGQEDDRLQLDRGVGVLLTFEIFNPYDAHDTQ